MSSFIEQVFIITLSFSESLATKCLSLNNKSCMVRPGLIDLNPVELKHYPFTISLDNCNGSCDVSSPEIFVSKDGKDINVKAFNKTNKNEAKPMVKHISCDCKFKFSSATFNSNQKWNNETCQCVKVIVSAKTIIVGILGHVFVRTANI